MSSAKRSFFSTLPGRVLVSVVGLGILLGVMFITAPDNNGGGVGPITPPPPPPTTSLRSDKELGRILNGLEPGRLGISTEREELTNQLNSWTKKFPLDADAGTLTADAKLLEKLFAEERLKHVQADLYLPEDASHVRESLLCRQIVEHVTDGLQGDTEKVVALFDFTTRYIAIIPATNSDSLALTPYESLLFGVGRAPDRAWVFAALLRQLRLDAVIVQPKNQDTDKWLVGVIVPEVGTLLFDTQLGLPIPVLQEAKKTGFPQQPATLKAVLQEDAILRQFDAPQAPYPLTAKDLQDVSIEIIGTTSSWAPRIAKLQFMLPTDTIVDLYDGLGENEIRKPGKLERVQSAGAGVWSKDDVGLWAYPDQQIAQIETAHGAEGTELGQLLTVFSGPYVQKTDETTGLTYQAAAQKSLHMVRVQLLQGEYAEALKNFFLVRTAANRFPTPANTAAADYASVWTGMCQYEQGKFKPALNSFQRYVNSHNQGEGWSRVAYEWASRVYAVIGQTDENFLQAAQLLGGAPRDFSEQRDYYLIKRWLTLAGKELVPPGETSTEESESPPTDEPDGESAANMKPKEKQATETTKKSVDEPKSDTNEKSDMPQNAETDQKPAGEKSADAEEPESGTPESPSTANPEADTTPEATAD